jgi:hypothetical protein
MPQISGEIANMNGYGCVCFASSLRSCGMGASIMYCGQPDPQGTPKKLNEVRKQDPEDDHRDFGDVEFVAFGRFKNDCR